MVSFFSESDSHLIQHAISDAEAKTAAEIVVAVTHFSSRYLFIIALYAVALTLAATLVLKAMALAPNVMEVSGIFLALWVLFTGSPAAHRLILKAIPKSLMHSSASKKAAKEFADVHKLMPANTPYVLVFLSIAERHVALLPTADIASEIASEQWSAWVADFTQRAASESIAEAAAATICNIGNALSAPFPEQGNSAPFSNELREVY